MKAVNLYFLTRVKNPSLYTEFENVLSDRRPPQRVKSHEFENLIHLVDLLLAHHVPPERFGGFYYGYSISQIGKEFDLLKIKDDQKVLNIELKSRAVPEEKIERQLLKNEYYLSCIAPDLALFTYVEETGRFYTLRRCTPAGPTAGETDSGIAPPPDSSSGSSRLIPCRIEDLTGAILSFAEYETGDIDALFRTKDYLISPLNEPERFAAGRYFLTQQQEMIKKGILTGIKNHSGAYFQGITGDAGTGKTLLLYDLARECAAHESCLIIHGGPLSENHRALSSRFRNLNILEERAVSMQTLHPCRTIFVDEAQRMHVKNLDLIVSAVREKRSSCIFSYDYFLTLSKTEQRRNIPGKLLALEGYSEHKLSGRIRSNREIGSFIRILLDLNDTAASTGRYDDVEILYAADEKEAAEILSCYCREQNYVWLALEESDREKHLMSCCRRAFCTEDVIGQEFSDVLILIDDKFRYDEEGKLRGHNHANPDYIYDRMFFQAASRTREKLCVLVLGNEEVFEKLLDVKYRGLAPVS